MKITKLETFTTEFVGFVRATSDTGAQGWGQVSTYNADRTCEIFHRQIAPHALGRDALDFADTLALIGEREHKYPGSYLRRAMTGLDTALWDLRGKVIFVPIGNAGNITAIMSGFLKLMRLGIIDSLPRVVGVQSEHADPVFRYYAQDVGERRFEAVKVRPSVAQAAMIGNPVSFPRVAYLADQYEKLAGAGSFQVVQVSEQRIIESMLLANRYGHIACTQGGECLAGLIKARELGLVSPDEHAVLDATAHSLKFAGFQDMYFTNSFPPEYGVTPDASLANAPALVVSPEDKARLSPEAYTLAAAEAVVARLGLAKKA